MKTAQIEQLKTTKPTWPGRCVDMRLKLNKAALTAARATGHVRYGAYSNPNSFTGVKMAWEFSNELLEAVSADCAREVSEDLVSYCDHCNREFGELGC